MLLYNFSANFFHTRTRRNYNIEFRLFLVEWSTGQCHRKRYFGSFAAKLPYVLRCCLSFSSWTYDYSINNHSKRVRVIRCIPLTCDGIVSAYPLGSVRHLNFSNSWDISWPRFSWRTLLSWTIPRRF